VVAACARAYRTFSWNEYQKAEQMHRTTRRDAMTSVAGALVTPGLSSLLAAAESARPAFALRYILASSLYGYTAVAEVLAEVKNAGATAIDIWPMVHGNQREQLDAMGEARFQRLLRRHGVMLGCITQFKLGPFGLQNEMRLARRLGCPLIVTGGRGPKGLRGAELRRAVGKFVEQMKPHLAIAEETAVTIAIENHGDSLVESPDSIKWLIDLCPSRHLAIALAPYHLPQDASLLANLIRVLGNRIAMFYAWQHGMGCMTKLPKAQELLQMPGRGPLDFKPVLAALHAVRYAGLTEIFMHPVPRGTPILGSTAAVTAEVCRARGYLEQCLPTG
jgi:sugar phosphate isomerase/epimerase